MLNPTSDTEFVAFVNECAANVASTDELTRALKTVYPKALVRLREIAGELDVIWYVYRDGRWVPGSGRQEGNRDEG